MSNNKQSSVEWFAMMLAEQGLLVTKDYENLVTYKEAKAMHKEEIMEAFDEGQEYEYQYHINSTPKFYSDTYYNETFGGNHE
jgi:hypothetical protein